MRKLCLVGFFLLIVGCGEGNGTIPVSGIVKMDGQPVVDASVSFIPQSEGGQQATGTTDASGKFVLSTVDPRDGAMPGKYKVVIAPNTRVDEAQDGMSADEAMAADAAAAAKKPKAKGSQFPEQYTRLDKTPLTQEVPSKGPVLFELKSK